MLYPKNLKNRFFGLSKALGFDDCKWVLNPIFQVFLGIKSGYTLKPRLFRYKLIRVKNLRICTALFILIALVIGLGQLWYVSRDGFNVNRILYQLPLGTSTNGVDPEIRALLQNQTYQYLGRGRQCFVFESSDHQYVLKIPRFDRYDLPFFWKVMPAFNSRKRLIWEGRQERLIFTLKSFHIAGTDLQEQTAVTYLHFHQTTDLPNPCIVFDRLHRAIPINLNQTAFVLQEKKDLLMPLCLKAMQKNDRQLAEKMLSSFLDVVAKRAEKNIFNRDPSFLKNYGWDGERCVQIDIGSFWHKSELPPQEAYHTSLREGTGRLREWLALNDRNMLEWFEQRLEEKMNR